MKCILSARFFGIKRYAGMVSERFFIISIFVFVIIGLQGTSSGQKTNPLLRHEENYEFEKLQLYLEKAEKSNSDNLSVRYLKALLEKDAPRAIVLYQDIAASDSLGIYADRALWRIAQYYFIKGDYAQTYAALNDLIVRYPQSSYRDKAQEQLGRISQTGGHFGTAPNQARMGAISGKGSNASAPVSSSSREPKRGQFTIQAGAFSRMENASFMMSHLKEQGFSDVYISKRQIGNRLLYMVWVGSYLSKDEAEKEKERLGKKITNIEFFVKSLP